MSTMLDLFHARFEAVKAFVSTRGGFDHGDFATSSST
jgi:hypothetical protein